MSQTVVVNPGEIVVNFKTPTAGKVSFANLGIKAEDLLLSGGFLRIVFDFEGIGEHHYFQVPTIQLSYSETIPETHWQCDFNETTILDKIDHNGNSTVILLNRDTLASLEHHHENKLILHAEFPQVAQLLPEECWINFFK